MARRLDRGGAAGARQPQPGQAARDRGAAAPHRASKSSPPARSGCPNRRRTRPISSATRGSRRLAAARGAAAAGAGRQFRASASPPSAARPACSRRAGPGRSKDFAAAMARVHAGAGGDAPDRRAWFVAALCLAWPDGETATLRRPGRRHGGLAAAGRARVSATTRCSCPAGGDGDLRRDARPRRSTRSATAPARSRSFARRASADPRRGPREAGPGITRRTGMGRGPPAQVSANSGWRRCHKRSCAATKLSILRRRVPSGVSGRRVSIISSTWSNCSATSKSPWSQA